MTTSDKAPQAPSPKVGFVSLGCPKALVDSERILTQLRMEGYEVVPSYDDADVVVVNTCGFIDSAKQESLDAIGEAISENGKVIVTGCMGKGNDAEVIRSAFPEVLGVSGPAAYDEVVSSVHEWAPPVGKHDPFVDLVPPQGIKLTPRHYGYLKISEGCNHRCSFCIIPAMRGDLVSRPISDVVDEAKRMVAAGTRELLIISQDTSAYGVDTKYKLDFVDGRALETRMQDLAVALGELGVWVRLHYVYPYPHVDKVIPLMAEGKILPYLDIPFQHASPRILKLMKRPGNQEKTLERIKAWREICPDLVIRSLSSASPVKPRKTFKCCWTGWKKPSSTASAASSIRRWKALPPMSCPIPCPRTSSSSAGNALWKCSSASRRQNSSSALVSNWKC